MRGSGVLVLSLTLFAACTRTFSGATTQPNPLATPNETLRSSETIRIVRGDMDLEAPAPAEGLRESSPRHNQKYPLLNEASFTVVSRDRLRFHVQIDHKWQEYADLTSWNVRLVDDRSRTWKPYIERARTELLTTMWDREQRTALCSSAGRDARGDRYQTVGYAQDGWKRRQTLGSLSVFRGKADFVFFERDIFDAEVRKLKLVVGRSGEAFEFTWHFSDTVAAR